MNQSIRQRKYVVVAALKPPLVACLWTLNSRSLSLDLLLVMCSLHCVHLGVISDNQLSIQLDRVPQEKGCHGESHQRRIKDVRWPLMAQQVSITAHRIFDCSENVSNHNECRGDVEHHHGLAPIGTCCNLGTLVFAKVRLESHGGENKDGKYDDLQYQAPDDDPWSECRINVVLSLTGHYTKPGAAGLDDETKDIAEHENYGEPAWGNHRA